MLLTTLKKIRRRESFCERIRGRVGVELRANSGVFLRRLAEGNGV